jgi:hypothetical protein
VNLRRLVLSLSAAALLPACGSIADLIPDAGGLLVDAGTTDAGTGGGNGCTDLVNGGDNIPETAGFVFFGPSGGTIPDGTYHLTKFAIFEPGSVDPYLRRHALRVTGNKIEVVTQTDDGAEERSSGTFTTEGSKVTFTLDCPEPATHSFDYTASDTHFTHVIQGPDIKEVHTYEKQ